MSSLENQNILLISPESWDHIFVSKHHYARYLAKRGNRVYFLNPPSDKVACDSTIVQSLFSVQYTGFLRGLRFLPHIIQRYLIRKKFDDLEKLCRTKFTVVWSFDNSVFFDFSALPANVFTISHIVDLNQNFEFERASRTAHLCLGVIDEIVKKLKKYNSNSFQIRHGVQKFPSNPKKLNLPGANKIKALYIGNLQMPYIDWYTVLTLAKKNIETDFVFLGADNQKNNLASKVKVFQLSNVFYLPEVEADDIPSYLVSADILMSIYSRKYFSVYASPHKMMEYLASGKVILATWISDYDTLDRDGLIKMAETPDDYMVFFQEIAQNLTYWNNSQLKNSRMKFANENTYEHQIRKIQNHIEHGG